MGYSNLELENIMRDEIPLCKAMDLRVEQLSDNNIVISAPMEVNRNHHDSFFAGSLYSLSAITGWGLATNYAHNQYSGSGVVVRKAEIDYFHPVVDVRLTLNCQMPDADSMNSFAERLDDKGRARLNLSVDIYSLDKLAVRFNGAFTVLKAGY